MSWDIALSLGVLLSGGSAPTRMGVVLPFFLWVALTSHKPRARGSVWARFDCLKWRDGAGVPPEETQAVAKHPTVPKASPTA